MMKTIFGRPDDRQQPLELACFTWYVPEGGFEWRQLPWLEHSILEEPTKRREDALVRRDPRADVRLYDPLATEDLFMEFARLDATKAAVLAFANRYGLLEGAQCFTSSKLMPKGDKIHRKLLYGDSFRLWFKQIDSMRTAVEVWGWLTQKPVNMRKLRTCIEWKQDSVCYEAPSRGYTIADAHGRATEIFARWHQGEILGPARLFVAQQINEGLNRAASPRLLVDADGKYQPSLVPHHLRGALWFQFYQAFIGKHRIRRCVVCGNWMTYTRTSKRMHSKCSHRERQVRYMKGKT